MNIDPTWVPLEQQVIPRKNLKNNKKKEKKDSKTSIK